MGIFRRNKGHEPVRRRYGMGEEEVSVTRTGVCAKCWSGCGRREVKRR